jgi:hypothetical protein
MGTAEPHPGLHELGEQEKFVVWASRHYLWSAVRGTPVPDFVYEAFANAGIDFLYYSLDRILVCLLAAPSREITVHDVRCPCVAQHEKALLEALQRLQRNDDAGFATAMTAIMLPSAVKVAQPAMTLLAAGMTGLKTDQLSWLRCGHEAPDAAMGEQDRLCSNRTIN